MIEPRLGIWTLGRVLADDSETGRMQWTVLRNNVVEAGPYIFKGHAVRDKGRMIREEGLAVQAHVRANRR